MSNICRLCLRNDEHVQKHNLVDMGLCDTLFWTFGVEVETLDEFSKLICQRCLKNVNYVKKVKKFFQINQFFLKEKKCPLDFNIEVAELKIDVGTQTEHIYNNNTVNLNMPVLAAFNPVIEVEKLEDSEIHKRYTKISDCTYKQRRRENHGKTILTSHSKNGKKIKKAVEMSKETKLIPSTVTCNEPSKSIDNVGYVESVNLIDDDFTLDSSVGTCTTGQETNSRTIVIPDDAENIGNAMEIELNNKNLDSGNNVIIISVNIMSNPVLEDIPVQEENNETNIPVISMVETLCPTINNSIGTQTNDNDVNRLSEIYQIKPLYIELTKLKTRNISMDQRKSNNINLCSFKKNSRKLINKKKKISKKSRGNYNRSIHKFYEKTIKKMIQFRKDSKLKTKKKSSKKSEITFYANETVQKRTEEQELINNSPICNKELLVVVSKTTTKDLRKNIGGSDILRLTEFSEEPDESSHNKNSEFTEKQSEIVDARKLKQLKDLIAACISEGTSEMEKQYDSIKRKLKL